MRRFIVNFLLIIFSFVLQTTVFRYIDFGGITPNLLLILTVSLGLMRGDKSGTLVGFFCGLLVDVFFGTYIGFYALIYMYIGFIIGKFHKIFFPQNIFLPMLFIVVSDFVFGFTCYILFFLFRTKFDIDYYMLHVIVPEMVYTTIVSIFFYPVILRLNTWLEDIEQRSAKKFV